MTTISVENYLKSIYLLEQRHGRAKTKALAEMLAISLPSVTSMLQTLGQEDFVDYAKYKGVCLTPKGRQAALKVIRKHRLIELFLVDTLGYSWDEVHEEAERLEHAVSDELADRIDHHLSYPKVDPHGDPIPTADGSLTAVDAKPLDKISVGLYVRVERVLDQSPDVLRYLERVGCGLGTTIVVEEILPFDGQLFLTLHDSAATLTLSQTLAARILVIELPR